MHALLALALLATAPRAPAFELHALGVLGGDTDTNLSCYLLGKPGDAPTLMIDGGSVMSGLARWQERRGLLKPDASPTVRAQAAMQTVKALQGVLLTHAHLDHWGGLVDDSTLAFSLAMGGKPSLPIVGLPDTLDALHAHLFQSPLWVDFTTAPPKNPALALHPLKPGETLSLGGFALSVVLLHHTVPSAAFLVRAGDAAYLHLGDTGDTDAVWEAARPLLAAHQLRAVSVEWSFPVDEKLAAMTGHLARGSFLKQLAKLAGVAVEKDAAAITDADALALARTLAPHFKDCRIFVIHVKALSYDAVKADVTALQHEGLDLVLPEQGESYRF
ncbi:MAG: 3',5'-cyclic-nucleotide phosphodiesterase [Deltaproteobacteria bacterium]|nr:3',5'-cyclic-nucleotide phosphodiesterase [Deltaproteobacteria bacterium]